MAALSEERVEKIAQLLYGVMFFNIFTMEELCDIVREARLMKWKKFEKGARIFGEGEFDQHFYIVIRGNVDIKKSKGNNRNSSIGKIGPGEILGEKVICDPENPRNASAYVTDDNEAVLCEIDGTLLDTVSENIKVKFMKKFLDLIVDRLGDKDSTFNYYNKIIDYARNNKIPAENEYFKYSADTAVSKKNRLTQFIKYTDFLVSTKIDPVKGCDLLQDLLPKANKELDEILKFS